MFWLRNKKINFYSLLPILIYNQIFLLISICSLQNKYIIYFSDIFLNIFQLGKKIKTPADQEIADYQDLMNWLTTEAVEVLEIVEQPVEDRQQEYMVSMSSHRLLHE